MANTTLSPPVAEKRPVTETWHGYTKHDDYKWLKAENWQEVMQDPSLLPADIRAYLDAENAYTRQELAGTEALQAALFAEMRGRIKEDDQSVPAPDGPYEYASAYVVGGQYPVYKRVPKAGGPEQILFDVNAMAAGHAYYSFGGHVRSPDHRLAAWSADDKGSEFYTLRVRNLETGADLPDVIERTTGSAVWSADGQHLFYTEQDDNHRPLRTLRHKLGTPQSEDVLVYAEADTGMFTGVSESHSAGFIVISVHDHTTSENWIINAERPLDPPHCITPRVNGIEYEVEHWRDQLIIKTNLDGAEDYKLVTAPLEDPRPEHWTELVPHRPGVFLVGYVVFKDWLVRLERENALPRIVVRHMESGAEHDIAFDEEAYALGFSEMREFDTEVLRFSYSSPTTPAQVFDYNMRTRERVLRKTQDVPSGHDASHYVTRRLLAPSHDGELVPITLLYRKDTPLDGSAPLWLYGYGSYGISLSASFKTNLLSLVDRGFIYATAHIRGGQEKGRRWYKTGKLENKSNTFRDFIACGEFLAREGFTRRGRIVAEGGSAGGLLMGAVANMAPDLFKAIVAEVPFVDALTTMLDSSLPLTPPEWPEWGNPITDKAAYETIASYAPYENVQRQAYPHIFALGGLTDPRVTYWEPAKWIAKLRTLNISDGLILLKTNMGAGHGGASGRFDQLKEVAEYYAFGIKVSGRAGVSPGQAQGTAVHTS